MPLPNNAKNDVCRVLDRRVRVAALYLEGKSQQEIARLVGVTQPTVCKDLAAVREEWKARSQLDYVTRLAEELAHLDRVESEAWAAYHRSTEPVLPNGPPQPGDARFLEMVRSCVETRLKLLGVFKPAPVNVNQVVVNWETMFEPPARRLSDDLEDRIANAGRPALPAASDN